MGFSSSGDFMLLEEWPHTIETTMFSKRIDVENREYANRPIATQWNCTDF
jgi:hypothetical protein